MSDFFSDLDLLDADWGADSDWSMYASPTPADSGTAATRAPSLWEKATAEMGRIWEETKPGATQAIEKTFGDVLHSGAATLQSQIVDWFRKSPVGQSAEAEATRQKIKEVAAMPVTWLVLAVIAVGLWSFFRKS